MYFSYQFTQTYPKNVRKYVCHILVNFSLHAWLDKHHLYMYLLRIEFMLCQLNNNIFIFKLVQNRYIPDN